MPSTRKSQKRVYYIDFANRTHVKVLAGQTRAEIEVATVQGLRSMKAAGLLNVIHTHSNRIEVELPEAPGQKRPMTWRQAQAAVAKYRAELASQKLALVRARRA